ncbi:hypothetical protein Bbelb_228890 [Branchiostoma belcheri]|nr:hypothetical protein Bbelb_228890 [Branchiostoma belcheri]
MEETETSRSIRTVRTDVFTVKQLKSGAVILHVVCSVYMFLGTAIVCEDYFMPSLLIIANYLHLKPSVTGATLIALGMSMPELVSSAVGVFVSKNDIGVGVFVSKNDIGVGVMAGTAVANYTLIIGCCCLMMRKDQQVHLKPWPLTRDTVWYIFSLGVLIIIIFNGKIDWSESLCLLVVYVLYIFSMFFDDVLQSNFDRLVIRSHPEGRGATRAKVFRLGRNCGYLSRPLVGSLPVTVPMYLTITCTSLSQQMEKNPDSREKQEDEEEPDSVLAVSESTARRLLCAVSLPLIMYLTITLPESTASRLLWAVSLPLTLPMYLTVPDCRRRRWRNWFLLTFFMSMVWSTVFSYLLIWMVTVIGCNTASYRRRRWRNWFLLTFFMSMVWSTVFSYLLIWMVTVIGFTMGASDTLMGITLLGAGTSVPDLVACVVATWAGEGDMAISATIGAIIFDILVCLGLPWFVKTVFLDHFGVVFVQTAGLSLTLSVIFLTIAFAFAGVCLSGWQFRRAFGAACLVVYVAFIVFAVFTEEYFAGTVAVFPECDIQPSS